jgi:2-phospho-L-lactate guanylyltransferase
MKRWVIVPVKRLTAAKSRLSPTLPARQRRLLARALLNHTLKTLRGLNGIEGILVVSKDRAVRSIAGKFGAVFVREGECDGLNRALARATDEAVVRGAEAVMVLPADLPLLRARDLEQAMRLAHWIPFVVIAPDGMERGTNLLYLAPPGVVKFSFGEGSFQKHIRSARRVGLEPAICRQPALAHDIDRPEDLAEIDDRLMNRILCQSIGT